MNATRMTCTFCATEGHRAVRARYLGATGLDDNYACDRNHRFVRLASGELRLVLGTPQRIERNNGSLY